MVIVIHWFMTAPLPVIFAAGLVIGVPLWLLVTQLPAFRIPPSPYSHAQREYEKARDEYQSQLRVTHAAPRRQSAADHSRHVDS